MGTFIIERRTSAKTGKEYIVLVLEINNKKYFVFDQTTIYKIMAENHLSI